MNDLAGENELLRASLAGSREAFSAVVQYYQSLVCAITYSATGDVGRSEELAQETFIRAWRNLPQLEDVAKFRAWLCTIARNLSHASIRGRSKDVVDRAGPLERTEAVVAAVPGPSQTVIDKERQELVWSAVQRIPESYREPLVLFYRRQRSVSARSPPTSACRKLPFANGSTGADSLSKPRSRRWWKKRLSVQDRARPSLSRLSRPCLH